MLQLNYAAGLASFARRAEMGRYRTWPGAGRRIAPPSCRAKNASSHATEGISRELVYIISPRPPMRADSIRSRRGREPPAPPLAPYRYAGRYFDYLRVLFIAPRAMPIRFPSTYIYYYGMLLLADGRVSPIFIGLLPYYYARAKSAHTWPRAGRDAMMHEAAMSQCIFFTTGALRVPYVPPF